MEAPTRRRFLGGALGAVGLGAAGAAGYGVAQASPSGSGSAAPREVSLYGTHQPGIVTPAQDRLAFASFDVTTTDRQELMTLLGLWAAAAHQMVQGKSISGAVDPSAPPLDTGEAEGLQPGNLTVTVGFGPSLFDQRFGLGERRPAALVDLPAFPNDQLEDARSGGDLCVQACSDDPQVAFHVIRNLARTARGSAVMRWMQLGFGKTSATTREQATPRNLMGFKDGTNNVHAEDTAILDSEVWVGADTDQAWMKGGSYLVARRIRMLIESWDTDPLSDQENVFGRIKDSGAPLGGRSEFETVPLTAKNPDGTPVIPEKAHVRLAAPSTNGGRRLLRRGYSYTDGVDTSTGLLDAGLFFIAYQRDPRTHFIPIQNRLGHLDALNEYIRHTGSAVFAVPPGLSGPGDWFGKAMFA